MKNIRQTLKREIRRWKDRHKFYIAVHEPMMENISYRTIGMLPYPQTLAKYLVNDWFKFDRASINGIILQSSWEYYVPSEGDRVELFPAVATKTFSNAYIAQLNAESGSGVLLKSVIITENPVGPIKKYFVDHHEDLVVDGNTYKRLPMRWDGYEMSASMKMPSMKISTYNIGQHVSDYVEEIDILGNEAVVQILHLDFLSDITARDSIVLQVQSIEGDDLFITFSMGLDLGLSDLLPRGVITKAEFPGIVDSILRF